MGNALKKRKTDSLGAKEASASAFAPASALTKLKVKPKFEVGKDFVRFNVESVDPRPPPGKMEGGDVYGGMSSFAAEFYDTETPTKNSPLPGVQVSDLMSVEAQSALDPDLVSLGGSGLFDTALLAFAGHHPLAIRPDDIWSCIAYGFSRHVLANSSALRSVFVAFEGKKKLTVETRPNFKLGEEPPEAWQKEVFPAFSDQIREHIGTEKYHTIAEAFSTSTAVDRAVAEITTMAAMQDYFSYDMETLCGIPWIKLEGSREDWARLRERTAELGPLMESGFRESWLPYIIPVLDQFVAAYDGNVMELFWQNMLKIREHGYGSGSYSTISGWIRVFYPYLSGNSNIQSLSPWTEMNSSIGPKPSQFPKTFTSVPVMWKYFGVDMPLHFHAGSVGTRLGKDGALHAWSGWVVSHDPPTTREKALSTIQQRLEQLKREHTENDTSSTEATGYAAFYSPVEIRKRKIKKFQSALEEAAGNPPTKSTALF